MNNPLHLHIGPEYPGMSWISPNRIEPIKEAYAFSNVRHDFVSTGSAHQVSFANIDLDFVVHRAIDMPVDSATFVVSDTLTSSPFGFGTTPEEAVSRAGHYLSALHMPALTGRLMKRLIDQDIPYNPTPLLDLSTTSEDRSSKLVIELDFDEVEQI